MRKLSLLLFLILVVSNINAFEYVLECEVENYDEDETTIVMVSKYINGIPTFHARKENQVTYFIPHRHISYVAKWHNDAAYEINAEIREGKIFFNYKYFNYLREETEVVKTYDVTNAVELDYEDLQFDDYQDFDDRDGEIISSFINKDDWINERGHKIDGCDLYLKQHYKD